jgi:hypothetical protein
MSADRWRYVKRIYHEALGSEVESPLAEEAGAAGFLSPPAAVGSTFR